MKLNVGVIFGGKSVEHEISIITACEIMGYFDQNKYNVIPIYIDKNNVWYTGEHLKSIINYRDINLVKRYATKVALIKNGRRFVLQKISFIRKEMNILDIVLPLGHGTFMEDGSLQGYLNMLDIPYVGSDVIGSAIGQDKVFMKQILEANQIPISKYIWFYSKDFTNNKKEVLEKIKPLKYPLYIKPASLGSSIGISRVTTEEELITGIKEAIKYDKKILIEEQIKNVKEVNISVMGNYEKQEVSEIEEINSSDGFYTFKEKYVENCSKLGNKGKKTNPLLSKEMINDLKKYAIDTFNAINASGVARIDFLIDDKNKKIYVNEINTIPGSLSGYLWLAKKKSQPELLDDLIELTIKEKLEKNKIIYAFEPNLLENYDILDGSKINKKKK